MSGEDIDPVVRLRRRLQRLFTLARQPTYRSLETHAGQAGRVLRRSTISGLLNGPTMPRWNTVESFVTACAGYARARQISVPADLVDLNQWHTEYRNTENALSDAAARREQIAGRTVPVRRKRTGPAQLPAGVPGFTGRRHHLAGLDELLRRRNRPDGADGPAAPVISTIDGTAGVGKTALAVHWAHRVADQFPDGQLYVNLRGFDPSAPAMDPAAAVRGFLEALGVPAQRIPTGTDAQAAMYRSLLRDRRMLVLLDNARDTAQVRPLLPGTPGCLVIVTSRNQLVGLVATAGAHPISLELLTFDEARQLLVHRLGTERIAAEADAVTEIVTRCARLPLALTLVAARAAIQPHTSLSMLAEELRDAAHRWRTLSGDDAGTDMRGVISWSYQALTAGAAHMFRLLSLHPGPDFDAPAAASLAAVSPDDARTLLTELTKANMVDEPTPGRFAMHDLLVAYAGEVCRTTEPVDQQRAASRRVFDHYLHGAYAAERKLAPTRTPITVPPPESGVVPPQPADGAVMEWFVAEHDVLMATVDRAYTAGYDGHVWRLSWALQTFLYRQGRWRDQVTVGRTAVAAAERQGDISGQALAHRNLGGAYVMLGSLDHAHNHLQRALELCGLLGDEIAQADTHRNLGYLCEREGQIEQALHHGRQALRLFRSIQHRSGEAKALNNVGWYHALLGDHPQALAACREALALHQELDDRFGQAGAWDSLGYAHHHLGQHADAIACYRQAATLYHSLGDRFNEATILVHLGDSQHAVDDPAGARDTYQRALATFTELEHPDVESVRSRLASLATSTGALTR